eukprot:maker-scaffold325_size206031-snap-gene-1.12 protein:Tk11601 transcript:maker-scaffold325_size206031-snap-gene-1.12-mRNA-1 annotation:"lactosylceramide 4-alpha-galactosyltransferase-like"
MSLLTSRPGGINWSLTFLLVKHYLYCRAQDIMHHLDSVPNLHFVRMNFHEIIEELPILKQWFPRTKFKEQVKFLQFALGNFARLVLLFQKGGVYIDYDVVVLREMHSDCKNFVMSDQRFTGRAIMGVMAFEKGNQYISEIFNYATSVQNQILHPPLNQGLKPLLNITLADIPNNIVFSLLSSGSFKIFHYCSLESAAKSNPDKEVYAIMNSSCSPDILDHLESIPNLHFARINFHDIIEELPILKQWFPQTKFKEQVKFLQFDLANYARLVLLFLKGGVYIDYDVIVLREMHSDCKNFIMADQRFTGRVIMGILGFEKSNHYITEILNYAPELSKMTTKGGNIQRVMVQVFKDKCKVPEDFSHFFNSPECPLEWGIQAGLDDK